MAKVRGEIVQGAGYDKEQLHHVCSVSMDLIKAYMDEMKELVDNLIAAGFVKCHFLRRSSCTQVRMYTPNMQICGRGFCMLVHSQRYKYGHKTSQGMRFVCCPEIIELEVVRILEVEMYKNNAMISQGQAVCPFYGLHYE